MYDKDVNEIVRGVRILEAERDGLITLTARLEAERDEARAKLDQAVAAEREACAKVCDKNAREAAAECKRRYSISSDPDHDLIAMKFAAYDGQAQRDAAAIRARSNDPH